MLPQQLAIHLHHPSTSGVQIHCNRWFATIHLIGSVIIDLVSLLMLYDNALLFLSSRRIPQFFSVALTQCLLCYKSLCQTLQVAIRDVMPETTVTAFECECLFNMCRCKHVNVRRLSTGNVTANKHVGR